ncbi:MAG TPA: PAS domain S-box protein [Sedimentisphaerales bacterium]|nr:PAS domain S-box protein [Sedimentisphaerales bacterium]
MPTPLRILIIEDDVIDRKLLERLLSQSTLGGCDVKNADRLATALSLLKEHPFDIILLDLGLPDSQGMDSVSRLQAYAPHLPIIVLSGLDDENTATHAVQRGVQDYLIKGQVDTSLLMRAIRYALERKKAERQLQSAELRYRTIFDNSAVAIMMVDAEERLVSWNKFTEQLLGMGEQELRNRHVKSLYPESEWQKIRLLSVRRKGMQHHLETRMICADGKIIDVDISLSIVYDSDGGVTGSIGVIRDITERKQMEEALRRSERRFRQVAENAREWIWEVDTDGVYTYASPVVEKILGYAVEEILGRKRMSDFFHPGDAGRLIEESREVCRRRDVFMALQLRAVAKNGNVVWLLRSGVPILDESGNLVGYRGADIDITERKTAEEALRRHVREIERFNRLATARELRIVELKQKINELAATSGQAAPYMTLEEEASASDSNDSNSGATVQAGTEAQRADYTLTDFLSPVRMQDFMNSFCDAVGVAAAIVDPQGNVFLQSRWQRICSDFHRVNAQTCARCVESDTRLAGQLNEGERFSLYQCHNGLTDAASPILVGGRHVGNVFIGQFLLEPANEEFFRRQAREFGFDETAYLEALSCVPVIPREKLGSILQYLATCAQLMAEVGLERLQGSAHESDLLRWAQELNRANQALRQQREAALSLAEDANEARATAERVQEALLLKDSAVNSAASGIVFVDPENRLTFANPSALRMWGYTEESEILGKPLGTCIKSAGEAVTACRSALESGTWNGDMEACRADGSDFIVQVSASAVRDASGKPICLMVSLVDVTESRRIQEILNRKQKNLEAIFDATPLGMLLVNDHLTVTRANGVVRQMSGKDYASIIGCGACQTLGCVHAAGLLDNPGDLRSCEGCLLRDMVRKALVADESVRGREIQLALRDDKNRPWMAVSVEPVHIDGSKHVLIAMNDITDRKRAEEELQRTMELKAQFISTVSHELRTPLSSMREAVIIVLDGVAGKINKDQRHFLDVAKRNIDRLSRLIDDVLDFQKLNAGKMRLNMQPNSIVAAVNEVFNTMQPNAGKSGVHLAVDSQPDLPAAVYDNDRILQVLINLVSNAIKFTPPGGRVQMSVSGEPDHVVVRVSDTGYGIPKEDLSKIFDRFYRVNRPGKEIKGTGLGLTIVSKIVAAHGGRIEVESELEKGTTFTVFLPLVPPSAPAVDADRSDQCLETVLLAK